MGWRFAPQGVDLRYPDRQKPLVAPTRPKTITGCGELRDVRNSGLVYPLCSTLARRLHSIRMTEKELARLFINGRWVDAHSKKQMEVRNPATLEFIKNVADCDQEDVNAAVSAARAAQREWEKTPAVEKAAMLHEVARRIRKSEE